MTIIKFAGVEVDQNMTLQDFCNKLGVENSIVVKWDVKTQSAQEIIDTCNDN